MIPEPEKRRIYREVARRVLKCGKLGDPEARLLSILSDVLEVPEGMHSAVLAEVTGVASPAVESPRSPAEYDLSGLEPEVIDIASGIVESTSRLAGTGLSGLEPEAIDIAPGIVESTPRPTETGLPGLDVEPMWTPTPAAESLPGSTGANVPGLEPETCGRIEDWDGFIYRSIDKAGSEEKSSFVRRPAFGKEHLSPVSDTYGIRDGGQLSITIVGIGGAGNSMVAKLKRELDDSVLSGGPLELLAVDTNIGDLYQLNIERKILLGEEHTAGSGTDGSFDMGRRIARDSIHIFADVMGGSDVVIPAVGMGGGTGSGMASIVTEAVQKKGTKVIPVVTLPFRDEGITKKNNSDRGLNELLQYSDKVLAMPNDFLTSLDADLPLIRGFQVMDELITLSILRLRQMLTDHWDGTSFFFSGGGILHVLFSQGDIIDECWDAIRDDIGTLFANRPVREALVYALYSKEADELEYSSFRHRVERELAISEKEIFIKSRYKALPAPVELMALLGFYDDSNPTGTEREE